MLRAEPGLLAPIVAGDGDNYTVSRIWLNGDKYNRTYRGSSCVYNSAFYGNGYLIDDIDSEFCMCGSALYLEGSGYEVRNSSIEFNGDQAGSGLPISDGITATHCNYGYIHDNFLWDNTDVDLIIGQADHCTVTSNTIQHTSTHGYAGLMFHTFGSNGLHEDSSNFSGNSVSSTYDNLAFGIMVGPRAWESGQNIVNADVTNNSATGAVINLAVDGIIGGQVTGNYTAGHQGTWGNHYTVSADYTVGDTSGTTLDPGYSVLHFDAFTCW